jgi:hypothetical protein
VPATLWNNNFVTKQTKTCAARRGFSRVNPNCLYIAALLVIGIHFSAKGLAQGNLVDLYDWSDQSTPYAGFINVYSSDSAVYEGDYGVYGGFNHLNLADNISTTPGLTYDVSFTLLNESSDDSGTGSMIFGDLQTSLDYAFSPSNSHYTSQGYVFSPVTYTFSVLATDSSTPVSFNFDLDEGMNASVSDFMITPVPEISTDSFLLIGGCTLVLARETRKLLQQLRKAEQRP